MPILKLSGYLLGPALLLTAVFQPAPAQTFSILYVFDETPHGCCSTYPGILAQGRDGNIYGTTLAGGAFGYGSVFVISPGGGLTTLYSFTSTDGGPQSGLAMGLDGNFYGTTSSGGGGHAGTIFKITPTGSLTFLYNFFNNGDGAYPRTPPIPAPDGNLYGVSAYHASSTLYRITPSGTFTVLQTLPSESYAPLTLGTDGKLYGVTDVGGTFNEGMVFSYTISSGVFKTVYNFGAATGYSPYGALMQAGDGNFYSTASLGGTNGGGVVYKLSPSGVYKVLHNFTSNPSTSGAGPTAGLVLGSDGNLYGTTSIGGLNGYGTIFRLKTTGAGFSVIYNFAKSDGANPNSTPLLHTNGVIYGLTAAGGLYDDGIMYTVDAGLKPFASVFVYPSDKVGSSVGILGQGFLGATGVLFGSGAGTFTASADTYMTAKVVAGATTGPVTVKEPGGNLVSPVSFKIVPTITNFSPPSGPVGTSVVIKGMSLSQATAVKFGGVAATAFTVNSNTQVTATVPTGAVTGKITITTPGGTATSSTTFTVQ